MNEQYSVPDFSKPLPPVNDDRQLDQLEQQIVHKAPVEHFSNTPLFYVVFVILMAVLGCLLGSLVAYFTL